MNQQLPPDDDDEIKYLLLSEDETTRLQGSDVLLQKYGQAVMQCIEYHHPGLNIPDREAALIAAIERFTHLFRQDSANLDRPIKPQLLRVAFFVGREVYRKVARRREREVSDVIACVAETLKDSELGATWHDVMDTSFRTRVSDEIRRVASNLKPRQRQIALMLAETWGFELTEHESIHEIFRTSGERLTRNQFKRALDEVRNKLRQPILKILIEEGICPTHLKNLNLKN